MRLIRIVSYNDLMILSHDRITVRNALRTARSAVRNARKGGVFFQDSALPSIEVAVNGGRWHKLR